MKTFSTVEEVLTEVLGKAPANSKSNTKAYDVATPTRISHITEIMVNRQATLDVIEEATQRLYASGWLKKPAHFVTAEDIAELLRRAPWNDPNFKDEEASAIDDSQGELFHDE